MSVFNHQTIQILDLAHPNYPHLLKKISNPPKRLFIRAGFSINDARFCRAFSQPLAVVGSRHTTSYGELAVESIVKDFSNTCLTIVSGFMYGIDSKAHLAALDNGVCTVAVMPCGVNVIHPSNQKDLYMRILKSGGIVVSEYEPDEPPKTWTFPARNRIVAGISLGTLVIEAAENSGTLITANYSKKFNRPVFAVPGSIFSSNSLGIIGLLRSGAYCVESGEYILNKLGISREVFGSTAQDIAGPLFSVIWQSLKINAQSLDELSAGLKLSLEDTTVSVSELCLNGLVKERGGKYYVV